MNFIHFTQPAFGKEEEQEVLETLRSGWVTLGPKTKKFEEDFATYVGTKYAIAVTSCTAALHLSLASIGIGPGVEVITTPFTFVATVNPIVQLGAKPVFVDIDVKTFNIDVAKIEEKITKRTKAIIPVHYGGQSVEMETLLKIAKKHKLVVIEDAAHALGAKYKNRKIGSIGDLTCFSFHAIKNISTGDGGMITTNDKKLAEKLIMLRLHGMSRDAWKRHTAQGSWQFDVILPGYKYNMTDISAALGIHQLRKLESFLKVRDQYAKMYDKELSKIKEITIPYVEKGMRHVRTLYTVRVDTSNLKINRDQIIEELKKAQIGAHVQFIPVHHLTYYKKTLGIKREDLPVVNKIFNEIISLPLYPKLKTSEVTYIIHTLKKIIEENRK